VIRFALLVTLVEIGLTAGAALLIAWNEEPEPFLTRDDLRTLDLPYESLRNERVPSLQALHCYESRAVLRVPRQSVYVSYRVEAGPKDLESRREKERALLEKKEAGQGSLIDEPFDGERGYAVRHRGPHGARMELVRARGRDLFIVRVSQEGVQGAEAQAAVARCDRLAHLIQHQIMTKLRWRD